MGSLLRIALTAFLVAATSAPGIHQDGIALRWRGKVGDVLRMRMTMTQTMKGSMMPQAVESESAFVFRQEVEEVSPDGVGSLELEYEAVRMQVGGPAAMDYDSTRAGEEARKNDPKLAALFHPLLDATVHMKIEPSGRVTEIRGLEEALNEAFEGLETPGMGEAFKQLFSENSLRRMVEVNVFPEKELAAGGTWQREIELEAPMLGTMVMAFENELVGTEERHGTDCARIAVTGEIKLELTDVDSPGPMEVSLADSEHFGHDVLRPRERLLARGQHESHHTHRRKRSVLRVRGLHPIRGALDVHGEQRQVRSAHATAPSRASSRPSPARAA